MMKTITLEDMKIKHHSLFKSFKSERIDWDHIRNDSDEPSYYIPEDQSSYERICSYQLNEENFKEINDLMAELKSTKIFSVGSGRSCLEYNLAKLNIDVIVSDKSNTIKRLKKLKIFTAVLNLDFFESIQKIRDQDIVLLSRIDTELKDLELKKLFNELSKKVSFVIFIPAQILSLKSLFVEFYIRFKSILFLKKKVFCGYTRSFSHFVSLWENGFNHKKYKTFYLLTAK